MVPGGNRYSASCAYQSIDARAGLSPEHVPLRTKHAATGVVRLEVQIRSHRNEAATAANASVSVAVTA